MNHEISNLEYRGRLGRLEDFDQRPFAGPITNSDRRLVAYAAVYPLAMILRVFVVQMEDYIIFEADTHTGAIKLSLRIIPRRDEM
jgi:hypothetical protein